MTPVPPSQRLPLETFIVLCGMPRCGTRQFADFLNAHPRLCLQGEIRSGLIQTIRATLAAGDRAYATGYAANYYRQKRAQGVIDLFTLLSKARRISKPGADLHGFKCPQMERQSAAISAIVQPAFARLVWLHCIRNPADCWLSLKAMPWFSDDMDQFVERYCDSLDQARAIADAPAAEGLDTRISPLDLDAFIAAADKPGWLGCQLFAPLGLAPSPEELTRIATTTDNRNATARATGNARATVLGAADHDDMARHAGRLEEAIAAYNARFGTALALRLPVAEAVAA
ncbi:hypothetical protein [Novosphingobium sp. GV061]|uniref:hypothetical protein n=1 Tax=Novosphingobium sp. GV061 TaxID=2135691 RepID=UPI000D3046CD|nr:hypothetical protein [Novosphingobium sp. GV061]PTR06000.1 hypothetical protein C8K11_1236 [Novosphingobium sp. GV055]PUA94506.1 hypothetical protein C8K12_1236 [Novosphingobium sp. GV061]PUB13043.1 hypothetical protein C8K14_1236 [Novosphingobium sp. GV079]PUB38161.1 hypothetical protein C8K10_1236 [Novosphingobium sp. GV027]